MKKLLLATALCLSVTASAFAAVTMEEQKVTFDYKYPIISGLKNPAAEKNINDTIAKELLRLRKAHGEDAYIVSGGMSYKLGVETDKYLSLTVDGYDYHGGAHGMYYTEGFVFDKETGKRLAYTDFVPKLNADTLIRGLRAGVLPARTVSDVPTELPFLDNNTRVSDNFILNEDGSISLIYESYELDCYAAGNIFVTLTPETVRRAKLLR